MGAELSAKRHPEKVKRLAIWKLKRPKLSE
jgi:hypothetical protein